MAQGAAHAVLEQRGVRVGVGAVVEDDVDAAVVLELACPLVAQRVARKCGEVGLVAAHDVMAGRLQVGDGPVGGVTVGFDDENAHGYSSGAWRSLVCGR